MWYCVEGLLNVDVLLCKLTRSDVVTTFGKFHLSRLELNVDMLLCRMTSLRGYVIV